MRRYRRSMGLRIKDVAKLIRRAPSTIGQWEHGHRLPPLADALALSAIYECPVEVLFLNQFQATRTVIRKRMAKLKTKRYTYSRSGPAPLTLEETPY